jgi:prolipoprotein diacylglyceryltransferase
MFPSSVFNNATQCNQRLHNEPSCKKPVVKPLPFSFAVAVVIVVIIGLWNMRQKNQIITHQNNGERRTVMETLLASVGAAVVGASVGSVAITWENRVNDYPRKSSVLFIYQASVPLSVPVSDSALVPV